jgi:hypothetical protein
MRNGFLWDAQTFAPQMSAAKKPAFFFVVTNTV